MPLSHPPTHPNTHSTKRPYVFAIFAMQDWVGHMLASPSILHLFSNRFICLFPRIFIFDERESKFFLLAQSGYLQRCVLTVDHLVDHTHPGRCSVLVFAGDTAGKISVWDITHHLIEYVKDEDDAEETVVADLVKEHEAPNFSCITLVQNSLGQPVHVFTAHQSGVNDISIYQGTDSLFSWLTSSCYFY